MGMLGGGGSSGGTQTTKTEPWDQQKPYLTDIMSKAQNNYNTQTPQYYPNSTVAPLSNTTNLAMGLQAARAINGSPLENATNNMATNTMNGAFMNSNPYLDQNFDTGARQITKAYNNAVTGNTAGMEGGGRLVSGMQAFMNNQANDTLGQNLGELYGKTYGQNYTDERTNQMRAMAFAPQMINQDYTDLGALSDVGNFQDTRSQDLTNADVSRWNYNQNLPYNNLSNYSNLVQGNYGGTSTATQPYSSGNRLGGIGAMASLGNGLFPAAAGATPWGAIGGGLLGFLGM